ncbi:MAG: hypothetical protein QNJ90_03855 [Planctomycetota bacterium]|nr:hypothetical protein [Planctomycetota bacterium]
MGQSILCPQCDKRFKLSDNPPAQATCSGCGTLMDLTAFQNAAPAAPNSPEPSTPKPVSHRASRAGARRRRRPAARRGVRQEGPRQQPAMTGGQQAILIFVGVLIVTLLIIVAARDDDDEPVRKKPPTVANQPDPEPSRPYVPEPIAPTGAEPGNTKDGAKEPERKRKVPLNRKGMPRLSRLELTTHAWPDEVPADVRARVDKAIDEMYGGGRDGVEAGEWLVTQGRVIAGRLISEFRAIEESPGFDNRDGAGKAMVIDSVLRRLDGQIERYWEERERIRAWGTYGSPRFIKRIARRWTWWWIEDEWKLNPRKPWDPFEDESDTTPDGRKTAEPEKDPKKKGYGKRAGSGD